ncbi:MAG TPA: hypothetical protein VGT98_15735 [Candidatus Elarobacter sp.]|nr:hypothetical protein [Candidatus Elarobacter sp.]
MKLRWTALLGVLVFSALAPRVAAAQATNPGGPNRGSGSELGQNSPNPFTSETRIPFTVGDYPACTDPSHVYRVSLRIYNILSQLVAVPVVQGGTGSVADGAPLESVELSCGQYTAYWDAKYSRTGQDAPPGIYLYRLELDGRPVTKKMMRAR